VLATRDIIATDNIAAEINVGQNVACRTTCSRGLAAPLARRGGLRRRTQDVGIKLKVTPHINQSDEVCLEISQEKQLSGGGRGQLGAVSTTNAPQLLRWSSRDQQRS